MDARITSFMDLGEIWCGMSIEKLLFGKIRLLDLELVQSNLDKVCLKEEFH